MNLPDPKRVAKFIKVPPDVTTALVRRGMKPEEINRLLETTAADAWRELLQTDPTERKAYAPLCGEEMAQRAAPYLLHLLRAPREGWVWWEAGTSGGWTPDHPGSSKGRIVVPVMPKEQWQVRGRLTVESVHSRLRGH